jgi:beta-alanine degradation protein BauB
LAFGPPRAINGTSPKAILHPSSGRLKETEMQFPTRSYLSSALVAMLLVVPIAPAAQPTTTQLPDPLGAGWKGQATCEKLHEDAKLRILRCVFPPNVGHERHFHAPHYVYVLDGGKVRVTSAAGTQEVEVKTGAGRMNPAIEWHEVLNVGETTMSYLIVEPK